MGVKRGENHLGARLQTGQKAGKGVDDIVHLRENIDMVVAEV